jgi:sugar/nucleoside kinase (ribokinase family)
VRGVAVVGSLASDVVADGAPRVGGAPFYAAAALRLIGRPSLVVTRCAERDRSTLLPPLVAQGPPVEWHASERTFRFRFSYDGDVRTMTLEEAAEPWLPGPWLDDLRRCDAVHVGALAQGEFPEETLAALARGRRVSLDGQGLVRVADPGPLRLEPPRDRSLLRHVSILKLAEEEAVAIAGGTDPAALAALGVSEVVLTRGEAGAVVVTAAGADEIPAMPVPYADPTGAGDAFSVAYLVSRTAGLGPASAARRATAIVAEMLVRRRRR